ncbi:MAG: response regulator [Magnetococcales bacterium]|nr:response regulator [Magnetococcales bacterium]
MNRSIHHIPIAYRITAWFSILIILLVMQFLLFDAQNQKLIDIHDRLVKHPFTVTKASLRLEKRVVEIRLYSDLILNAHSPDEIQKIEHQLQESWNGLKENMKIIQERFLGDMNRVTETQTLLDAWWHTLQQREIVLLLDNRAAEAQALHTSPEHLKRMERIHENLHYIVQFAQNKLRAISGEFDHSATAARQVVLLFFSAILLFGLLVAVLATRAITRPLREMNDAVTRIASKNFAITVPGTERKDEFGTLARSIGILQGMARHIDEESWIKSQVNQLSVQLQQLSDPGLFAHQVIHHLTPLLNGSHGACYLHDEDRKVLELKGGYGLDDLNQARQIIALGENQVGLCAQTGQTILLSDLPKGYVKIASGLGEAKPQTLILIPLRFQERTLGVVEIASFQAFTPTHHALLENIQPVIGINLESLYRLQRTRNLLHQSERQAQQLRQSEAELQVQGEELQAINATLRSKSATLEQQAMELRRSEEELTTQGEALQVANEELRTKNETLERHTRALQEARQVAERNAAELEQASRYKSEFLANMSHELRTPLNSLLILSRALAINPEGNLNEDQKESAQIIHDSGQDLLMLINDILDLAKVESGKMELALEPVSLVQLLANLERRFTPLAQDKGLALTLRATPHTPATLRTDPHKLGRILTNLLANAIKFTDQGEVTLSVDLLSTPGSTASATSPDERVWLAWTVHDTGIGIPAGQEERIFQAFQQVDGTTSRRHGGTGLGLTIARELATLLGGEIRVASTPGSGSRFTLTLPIPAPAADPDSALASATLPGSTPHTRRPDPLSPASIFPASGSSAPPPLPAHQKKTILIVEDDPVFARILNNLAQDKGFSPILAPDGEQGLTLAIRHLPSGVILDLTLPDMDGWSVLKQLKSNPVTREIPVHVISARDESAFGTTQGATDYWVKPIGREQIEIVMNRIACSQGGLLQPRHVLVIEDDPNARKAIATLLEESSEVKTTCVAKAEEALARLGEEPFCCMVLDLNLRGISGFELLERATTNGLRLPPVIIYSGRMLSDQETLYLRQYTDHIIIKGERSPERLQEEVAQFLHQMQHVPTGSFPPATAINPAIHQIPALKDKTVLIVDDDMRNIFALSKALRARGLQVLMAQDGIRSMTQLQAHPEIDLVIMDIMMPEMDGYTAMRTIRSHAHWQDLPIVALTAKAMSGEREKCLQAGANDYLAKPVDLDKLMAMMHHWLTRTP